MRLPLGLLTALGALALATPASADENCQRSAAPVASVLVIHGGSWTQGSAAMGREYCPSLAAMGYRVRLLEYPLHTVPGAVAYARDAAEEEVLRGRPVYALGYSAGGSIAEYLAVKSWIDGAVAVAPLSDFVDWRPPSPGFWDQLHMTPELRVRFSPFHNIEAPAPLRIVHSPEDQVVPYEQSVRMVQRCGQECELVRLPLGLGHGSLGARGAVSRWFGGRAPDPPFARSRLARLPTLSGARLRPRRLRAGRAARPNGGGGSRGPRAIFTYGLSEAAGVELVFERERVKRRGRAGAWRRFGSLAVQGTVGRNRTRFRGAVRGRMLRPGRYRATLTATNARGRRSQPSYVRFTVVGGRG